MTYPSIHLKTISVNLDPVFFLTTYTNN